MSHFTVLVRVPSSCPLEDLEATIGRLLRPYQEEGQGNEAELEEFMVFEDEEDEALENYNTKTQEMVRLETGELVYSWDDRFRVKDALGFGGGSHVVPEHLERPDVPFTQLFSTFEKYMQDYCGHDGRDPKTGRYGRWHNPEARWDWYSIGGRWSNRVLNSVHSGPTDICRINSINTDWVAETCRERVDNFIREWKQMIDGTFVPKDAFDDGARDAALSLGWLDCKDANELTGNEFWTKKWKRQLRDGVDRFDVVATEPDLTASMSLLRDYFSPLRTFAFLDPTRGWCERGKMGWFGCSSETPDSVSEFVSGFQSWVNSGDQKDFLVLVDCHI